MRDHPASVMLFAAGFGTRMGALTADCPKPLIPVAGKPLLDHALDLVRAYGASRVVANTHYLAEQVEQHLAGSSVVVSKEWPDILETGGGLRAALPNLGGGPVFTMNTDAIWAGANPLRKLADHWRPDDMDALLLCVPKERAYGHKGNGDFLIDQRNRAMRGAGEVYTGLQIIKTDRLHEIGETRFSLNLLWDIFATDHRLFCVSYPGKWCDVGQPESIAIAERMLGGGDV